MVIKAVRAKINVIILNLNYNKRRVKILRNI